MKTFSTFFKEILIQIKRINDNKYKTSTNKNSNKKINKLTKNKNNSQKKNQKVCKNKKIKMKVLNMK